MLGAALLLLNAAAAEAGGSWVYAYEGATSADAAAQTATWGGLCVTGKEQSPINVVTRDVLNTSLPIIATHFTAELDYVKNTGHGFQLFETSPQTHSLNSGVGAAEVDALGTPKGYSMIGGDQYNFYQVHWHTPSENTIDGKSYPLEAHFVHQLADSALVGTYHRLAVIGLLYELGKCNEFLDKFWSKFPSNKGSDDFTGAFPDLNKKLTDELAKGYYHWYGSLTTPPCTEGVSWNLLKIPETVCQRQIDWLKTALGNTQHGIQFNNRVPQDLNHRAVTGTGAGSKAATLALSAAAAVPAPGTDEDVKTIATATLIVSGVSLLFVVLGLVGVLCLLSSVAHKVDNVGSRAAKLERGDVESSSSTLDHLGKEVAPAPPSITGA